MKRNRRGLRVPGIRNRLNGDDDLGLYALMDWYCQPHLTYEDVFKRMQKYTRLYKALLDAHEAGRNSPRHTRQCNRLYVIFTTLVMVLSDWDKRNFN